VGSGHTAFLTVGSSCDIELKFDCARVSNSTKAHGQRSGNRDGYQLNPGRAARAGEAAAWAWSSAAAHCGTADPDACLDMATWNKAWSADSWRKFLAEGESEAELRAMRRTAHRGHPLGPTEFRRALEERTQRRLTPGKRGRPRKTRTDEIQPPLMVVGKLGNMVCPRFSGFLTLPLENRSKCEDSCWELRNF